MVEKLRAFKQKKVICVTHGKLLKALLNDIVGKKVKELEDCCIIEVDFSDNGKMDVESFEGAEFE